MRRKTTLGVLSLGLIGLALYRFRRRIFGGFLGLRPARHEVAVEQGIPIPMPDGVVLVADRYAPKSSRLFPTILIRTPYGRGRSVGVSGMMSAFIAQRFAERGYNVLIQDVRGRFESGGEFEPFVHETADGRATLDWIEQQSWFNGVLGMWGQSYLGYTQWAVAAGAPLYLKALMPGITASSLPVIAFSDRALEIDALFRWILELDAVDRKGGLPSLRGWLRMIPRNQDRILARAFKHLPLGEADQKIVGKPVPYYRKWMEHDQADDPYWQPLDHSRRLSSVTAAVYMFSGWYDLFLRETLDDYRALKSNGQTPHLTIGPWQHLDMEGIWESLRQGVTWFDAALKGDRRGLRSQPVRIYVMGSGGGWRELESWPPPARATTWHLDGSGRSGGILAEQPAAEDTPADTYIYNPADPTPSVGGPLMNQHGGSQDNRALEARPDVLTFTTSALEADLEVTGPVRLILYVRSSLEHTDFFGRVCDVYPDGRSLNICDGLVRLQPGKGVSQPDGSLRVEINLWPTAYRFGRGHAIRLQVSSGAYPRWNRNLGSGEPLATGTRMLVAEQTVYHDRAHPSALILPVTSR